MAAKKQTKKPAAKKPKPKSKPSVKSKAVKKTPVKSKAIPVTKAKKILRPKARKSAPKLVTAVVEVTETVVIQIDHAAISQRAYEIWEYKGRPEGDGHHNWVEAEAQLREEAGMKQHKK